MNDEQLLANNPDARALIDAGVPREEVLAASVRTFWNLRVREDLLAYLRVRISCFLLSTFCLALHRRLATNCSVYGVVGGCSLWV